MVIADANWKLAFDVPRKIISGVWNSAFVKTFLITDNTIGIHGCIKIVQWARKKKY